MQDYIQYKNQKGVRDITDELENEYERQKSIVDQQESAEYELELPELGNYNNNNNNGILI